MYKAGTMPAAPAGQGGIEGGAVGAPAHASSAAAHWHKRAGQPWHRGCAEMGCPGWAPGCVHPTTLLCVPTLCRVDGWRGSPLAARPRCAFAPLEAAVTAQRLHTSALAPWTFSRPSGGASGAVGWKRG